MVQAVFCIEILCAYGITEVTEEAFTDYFRGCLLTYPYKNMLSVGCFSAICDAFGLKHSAGENESLQR